MAIETTYARVLHKRDTQVNWEAANPVLMEGEIAFVEVSSTLVKIKVGDGAQSFNQLPYAGDLSGLFEIHAAEPTTNPGSPQGNRIYETSTPGTYVNFPDNTNTPIDVNAGEYVRIIDEGSFYSKVVLPFSTTGLVTETAFTNNLLAIYDLYYRFEPNFDLAANKIIDKLTPGTGGLAYTTALPAFADWYVDMRQSFDLSRLDAMGFLQPAITDDYYWAIVSINTETGQLTVIDTDEAAAVANIDTGVDLSNYGYSRTDPATRPALRQKVYIAIRNKTGAIIRTAANTDSDTWRFDSSTGALNAKMPGVDLPTEVYLLDMHAFQEEMEQDRSLRSIVLFTSTTDPYYLTDEDSTLVLGSGVSGNAEAHLPKFGISPGKVFTIKYTGGPNDLDIIPEDGAEIDGSAATLTIVTANEAVRLHFDGVNYWRI